MQGENQWAAKVIRTEAEIDPVTKMMAVVARINKLDKQMYTTPLAVGQFVQAKISGVDLEGISVLPRSSVRNESVWVVDKQMYAKALVEVIRNESEFALVKEGLN